MKHLKHLFTALLLLFTTTATAHDFNVDGIYYKITNATNKILFTNHDLISSLFFICFPHLFDSIIKLK